MIITPISTAKINKYTQSLLFLNGHRVKATFLLVRDLKTLGVYISRILNDTFVILKFYML